jgi:putative Ca2+/H+ antiporter (TMEM165/GDT1 family)
MTINFAFQNTFVYQQTKRLVTSTSKVATHSNICMMMMTTQNQQQQYNPTSSSSTRTKMKHPSSICNHRPSLLLTSSSSISSSTSTTMTSTSNESIKLRMHSQSHQPEEALSPFHSSSTNPSPLNGKRLILAIGASLAALSSVGAAVMYANPAIATTVTASAVAANNWIASLTETGFYQAFSLVFVSEIGDKTFFIAGLLAMKTSKLISFIGSMGALVVMTIISVVIGQLFHAVPAGLLGDGMSIPFDDIAAVIAFAFFGIKILRDALAIDESSESGGGSMDEELEEAKQAVNEQDTMNKSTIQTILGIFTLVFAAEFGDRSFISTIALSAAQNPLSVAGGAIAAHAIATGLAVSGGSVIAKYLSEKVIGIIGGTLFIVFAITTAFGIF